MTTKEKINQPKLLIIKHVFSYSMALGLTQILMMTYTIILMRWVAPEKFGIISANYATTLLLSFLINWGMNEWLVKTIPTSGNPQQTTGSVIWFKIVIGTVWGVIIWCALPFVQPGIYQREVLAIILFDVWLDSCFNLFIADRVGHEKIRTASILLVSSRVLRLASLVVMILINNHSINYVLFARLISTFIFLLVAWILVKPQVFRKKLSDLRDLFRQSISFNTYEMLTLIFAQIDINLLTWFVGSASLIGAYSFVSTLINMFMTIPLGIYSILLPGSIKTYRSSPELFLKRIRIVLVSFIAIAAAVWIAIALPGTEWMTKILGNDYLLSTQLLLLAAPILFIRVINQVNNVFLVSVGEKKRGSYRK
jgi:O-antigen/teichoic acid export membrane protein